MPTIITCLLLVLSLVLLSYTFIGYALGLRWLAKVAPRPITSALADEPTIAVVIAAHQAEGLISPRLLNLKDCAYPPNKIEIIVVCDGSSDATAKLARASGATVIELDKRMGKPACLNRGIAAAKAEIIVLTDVRQQFEPDALQALTDPFADPTVGAVSGELLIESSADGVGQGIGRYWEMERRLRRDEALTGSAVGCTGAIYAIRRDSYTPIPEDTLIDDVVIPMLIAQSGLRVLFREEARAFDPQPLDPEREQIRKRRTLAGNYQMLFRYPKWTLPGGHPLWWRLISHKYLRLAAPFLLALSLLANLWLAVLQPFFVILLIPHLIFYALAALGLLSHKRKNPFWLSIPAAFVFLNAMPLTGFIYYFRTKQHTGW